MKLTPNVSTILTQALLLFGLAILLAATPVALPDNNTDCKKDGTIKADGTISCDNQRPCDNTGELCQVTKWHKKVSHPYVRYCSCTVTGDYSGADPTTDICMAISIELPISGQVGKCSSSGCAAGSTCSKTTANKCECKSSP